MVAKLIWARFLIMNAFRNLWRAPRRTIFSLLAIAAAATSLMLSQSYIDGVKRTFRQNLISAVYAQYQIYKKGYRTNQGDDPFGYQITDTDKIKKALEEKVGPVIFFSRRQKFFGLVNYNDRSLSGMGVGIDAEQEKSFMTLTQVVQGKHLAGSKLESIFLSTGLAEQLKVKPGDMVSVVTSTAGGSLNAADLEVVGVFQTGIRELDGSMFYVHQELAQKLLRTTGPSQILLGFAGEDELKYKAAFKDLLKKDFPDLEGVHWYELAGDMFDNSMGWLEGVFMIFRIIIVTVATLSILTVFMISLLERTGEFGTLRAIGTYRNEVAALIFIESMLQSILGGLLGIVFSVFAIYVPLKNGVTMPPPPSMTAQFHVMFTVPWHGIATTLALCIAVAGGSGIFPALKIARLNIVEALGRNV